MVLGTMQCSGCMIAVTLMFETHIERYTWCVYSAVTINRIEKCSVKDDAGYSENALQARS